jgi:hypothetical protein
VLYSWDMSDWGRKERVCPLLLAVLASCVVINTNALTLILAEGMYFHCEVFTFIFCISVHYKS